jgi:hypothetical protein
MNEQVVFQIEEPANIMLQINGNNSTKNYTLTHYPNKHVGYDFAILIM